MLTEFIKPFDGATSHSAIGQDGRQILELEQEIMESAITGLKPCRLLSMGLF